MVEKIKSFFRKSVGVDYTEPYKTGRCKTSATLEQAEANPFRPENREPKVEAEYIVEGATIYDPIAQMQIVSD